MRRSSVGLLASVLLAAAALALPGSARAECPFFVIPPATDAARSAREVIVGRVIENVGGQLYDFRLRVEHVLRGPAKVGDVRRFAFVFPGWPLAEAGNPKSGPCEAIPGWEGNVIALSLDALAPDGSTRYNGASWIAGDLEVWDRPDLPRTTLGEMVRLAGLPQTDADALPGGAASGAPASVLVLLTVAATIVVLVRRRDAFIAE